MPHARTSLNAAAKLHLHMEGGRSLPFFKLTTQVGEHCVLSGETVRAAGTVTRMTTQHHTLRVSNFLQALVEVLH